MKVFAPNATDGYKLGHPSQYIFGTNSILSNYTPRDFGYANVLEEFKTDKMVYAGMTYVCKAYLIDNWNESFFNRPKEKVIQKYARRIRNYLGTDQAKEARQLMSDLHDLGYLPIEIRSIKEGSRVNAGIPVFTVTNSLSNKDDPKWQYFHALVNYLETVLSNTIWPICHSASLMEQYYLCAKHYGQLTGASMDFWLPFACHNFALRGHRGMEDGIMSAFGHSLFHTGTDTFAVADFIEDYYNGDTDIDPIAKSVNATEHATVTQAIAYFGGGHEGELKALNYFLTERYPDGTFSYVADSRDYWDVIANILPKLKDVIMSRPANVDGLPGCLTTRPDSSPKTPYEIILGDRENLNEAYSSMFAPEQKGTLQLLWETFGGEMVTGSDGKQYKLLDSHVRIIYGEAISLQMQQKIYKGMMDAGWCVGNVFFGVGSWAFLKDASRDSYGCAVKATHSEIDGVDYPLQKDPKGTSSFKKSARGMLRVEFDGEAKIFKLFDDQTKEQVDAPGNALEVVFRNSDMIVEPVFREMVAELRV
jgi:nicotinamide phosphoribosyltransferase